MPSSVGTQQGGSFWSYSTTVGGGAELTAGATATVVPNGRSGIAPIIKSIFIQASTAGVITVDFYNGSTARVIISPTVVGTEVMNVELHDLRCVGRAGDVIRITVGAGMVVHTAYIDGYFDDSIGTGEV